ncbi:MAG: hypothetical protein AAB225_28885 [Acidobacteriota bacterium]
MTTAAIRTAGILCLAGAAVASDYRGVIVGRPYEQRTYGSGHGFGNVVFPGTGTAPRQGVPFSVYSSFPHRLGTTVSGWPSVDPMQRRGTAWPVIYPVYVGGFYPYDQPAYQQPPNVTIIMPPQPQAQPVPPVTINQSFAPEPVRSSIQTYQAPAPPPVPEPEGVIFLIALKDSSVYSAVAYWLEGDTLHYITPQGKHNQVSLDLVDRAVSEKLNQGRKVEFRLPR